MFNESKYTNWYYAIINKAKCQTYNEYTEKHHIIPRSMKGTNEKTNLVSLSFREHFLCHWLLTKMCINKNDTIKMIHAFGYMSRSSKHTKRDISSWQYKLSKSSYKDRKMSEEQKAKLKLITRSKETKEKISKSQKNRFKNNPLLREHLASLKRGTKLSLEHIEIIKKSNIGRKHTKDQREKVKLAKSLNWIIETFDDQKIECLGLRDYAKSIGVSYTLLHKLYLEKTSRPKLNIKSITQSQKVELPV